MILPVYLALTQEEFYKSLPQGIYSAWMACEFSSSNPGLSNLPPTLPPGSMVILNDAKPLQSHREDRIAGQLRDCGAESILLDFQRPYDPQLLRLAEYILAHVPCKVGITPPYAKSLHCPVFLPPIPLNKTPGAYLTPWRDREIWLDTTFDAAEICVTPQGSRISPLQTPKRGNPVFIDRRLHCCYHTAIFKQAVCFTLYRTKETLGTLLASAKKYGVTRCIGIYQELCENSL